jgi:tRNA (Thr-GGU) A37 N-methylase
MEMSLKFPFCVPVAAGNVSVFMVKDVDILSGTPLLDIKSRIPAFDSFPDKKA